MSFSALFKSSFPVIGCIHLQGLPGAPKYGGNIDTVYSCAMTDATSLATAGVDGLIVENFNDSPFYKDQVPPETVAAMAIITQKIKAECGLPTGVNVLRNDARSAIAIAAAAHADFVRINIHMHAMVTDQGIIEGKSYDTLRVRSRLAPHVLIFADINVKHATPLAPPNLEQWVEDLTQRGMADAIIVSGSGTGKSTSMTELTEIRKHARTPVLIGSGIDEQNILHYTKLADGAIVGSSLKADGMVANPVDLDRARSLMNTLK